MRLRTALIGLMAFATATPALAQFSDSFKFLKALREGDNKAVLEALERPGATVVNTRSDTGETALHMVVRRRDTIWIRYLLGKGAKPELRDNDGMTPLALAAQLGFPEGVAILARYGNIDTPNGRGETPLILAVHNRDVATARQLLVLGANPLLTDHIAGKSARDYAADDPRAAPILRIMDELKKAAPAKPIAGPQL